ncbi:MAG: alanine racemase [Chloroflexi bacterium]|nr:alanine racemase [Ardenticatenaceae bacterium]MBL1130684.1 alanine racemase [Chloroflexota bacterium]NOG36778.1 alanine racemase [Chloroflexota bacterium]GIK57103.1 MAG: metal-activated pyridoxal enzyme [Chloroflexota bacterium]
MLNPIEKPTLLLDKTKTERNIERMVARAAASGVSFRPHFKTHQSVDIGDWFRNRGVMKITTSSVDMAAYFTAAGWQDILVAFPVNVRQSKAINKLAHEAALHLVVESVATAVTLNNFLSTNVNVWLKVDAGSGRTGIHWQDEELLADVAYTVADAPRLKLTGLLTHAGHTYRATSPEQIAAVYGETAVRLNQARDLLHAEGHNLLVSVGDTPACSIVDDFSRVDEIRPGNFVFYDLVQQRLGACLPDDIAVGVACPIVAKHEADYRIILYGGAVHLSRDSMVVNGETIYGRVARLTKEGWGQMLYGSKVVSLSQEHSILKTDPATFESLDVGDVLVVLPVHSCLTVDLYGRYTTLSGEVITKMRTNE